jgi:hypothetical protein
MAVALVAGDLIKVRSICKISAPVHQDGIMVWAYRVSALAGTILDSDVATYFGTIVPGVTRPLLSTHALYSGVGVQRVTGSRPYPLERIDTTNAGTGSETGDLLPPQCAALIKTLTALAGRKYRGRHYFPFAGEDGNDVTGVPTAAHLANMGVWGAALISAQVVTVGGSTAVLLPVILHKTQPSSSTDIETFVIDQGWGTQRRRGFFGRPN